jgi:predicted dehydrogenase
MTKTIKIAFIGLGEHQSRAHIKHLLTLQQEGEAIELVGAYDPADKAFTDLEVGFGIKLQRFASPAELITHPGLDAVFISSPDEFHTEQLDMAVNQGLHVFCEKPISVSDRDSIVLGPILADAQEKNLVVSTCHPRRFDPPFVQMKANLPNLVRKYGPLKHFDFSFWYHEVTDEWKRNRSLLSDHYGHEIDIVRFLLGAGAFEATKLADGYDFYEVTGTTDVGVTFRFMGSRALAESVYNESVRLDFAKGAVFFNLNTGEIIELPSGERFWGPTIDYDVRFLAVNKNFLNSIRGIEKNYLTPQDILANNVSSVSLTSTGKCSISKFPSLMGVPAGD